MSSALRPLNRHLFDLLMAARATRALKLARAAAHVFFFCFFFEPRGTSPLPPPSPPLPPTVLPMLFSD